MSFKHYASCAYMGVKGAFVYRFNFVISIFTTPIALVVFYFLWKAIFEYTGQEAIRGFTFEAMISYYALNMLVGFVIWTYVDNDLEEHVINGTLTPILLRPLSYFWEVFADHMGTNFLSILIEIIPISVIAVVFFGLGAPTIVNGIIFAMLVVIAMFINFMLGYLTGLTAFWFKEIGGIRRVRRVIVSFLAGSFIPLSFFPEWVTKLSNFLPFQYIRYVPITVYLGNYSTAIALWLFFGALLWAIGLYILSRIFWKVAYKKFAGSGT